VGFYRKFSRALAARTAGSYGPDLMPESLDDLIDGARRTLRGGRTESLDEFARRSRMSPKALFALRTGLVARPRRSSILGLARASGRTVAEVAAALAESRRRAGA